MNFPSRAAEKIKTKHSACAHFAPFDSTTEGQKAHLNDVQPGAGITSKAMLQSKIVWDNLANDGLVIRGITDDVHKRKEGMPPKGARENQTRDVNSEPELVLPFSSSCNALRTSHAHDKAGQLMLEHPASAHEA